MRVGAADLQCGVAVETVDSQNPSSYADYTSVRMCACLYMCDCVGRVRARARARARSDAGRDSAERGYTHTRIHTWFPVSSNTLLLEMLFVNKLISISIQSIQRCSYPRNTQESIKNQYDFILTL